MNIVVCFTADDKEFFWSFEFIKTNQILLLNSMICKKKEKISPGKDLLYRFFSCNSQIYGLAV